MVHDVTDSGPCWPQWPSGDVQWQRLGRTSHGSPVRLCTLRSIAFWCRRPTSGPLCCGTAVSDGHSAANGAQLSLSYEPTLDFLN